MINCREDIFILWHWKDYLLMYNKKFWNVSNWEDYKLRNYSQGVCMYENVNLFKQRCQMISFIFTHWSGFTICFQAETPNTSRNQATGQRRQIRTHTHTNETESHHFTVDDSVGKYPWGVLLSTTLLCPAKNPKAKPIIRIHRATLWCLLYSHLS